MDCGNNLQYPAHLGLYGPSSFEASGKDCFDMACVVPMTPGEHRSDPTCWSATKIKGMLDCNGYVVKRLVTELEQSETSARSETDTRCELHALLVLILRTLEENEQAVKLRWYGSRRRVARTSTKTHKGVVLNLDTHVTEALTWLYLELSESQSWLVLGCYPRGALQHYPGLLWRRYYTYMGRCIVPSRIRSQTCELSQGLHWAKWSDRQMGFVALWNLLQTICVLSYITTEEKSGDGDRDGKDSRDWWTPSRDAVGRMVIRAFCTT